MRVVSLLPSATEMLFAIGAGDTVAGVTHECDFPSEARALPVLTASALQDAAGDSARIDRHVREAVHAGSSLYRLDSALLERLQPDLIVTQELCEVCAVSYGIVDRAARRLASDPRVVSLEPACVDDVLSHLLLLGELTGHEQGASQAVAGLRARIDALAARTASPGNRRPRILLLEWTDPPMSAGHWLPELVELAGGEAVLAHPRERSRTIAWEDVAAADPDAIAVAPCGFDAEASARAVAALGSLSQWNELRAVREGRAYALDGNAYFSRPGPRLVDSAELLAELIAPIRGERRR